MEFYGNFLNGNSSLTAIFQVVHLRSFRVRDENIGATGVFARVNDIGPILCTPIEQIAGMGQRTLELSGRGVQ
jgi:hypothetical protein